MAEQVVMLPSMVVAMLLRRDEYSRHTGTSTPSRRSRHEAGTRASAAARVAADTQGTIAFRDLAVTSDRIAASNSGGEHADREDEHDELEGEADGVLEAALKTGVPDGDP
jgi:hypothetical protein